MAIPDLLIQLSDPHIGANWDGGSGDPVTGLRAAVEAVRALTPGPVAVLVSGDLTENADDSEYEQVREVLAPLDVPLHVLAGNHDDRDALHRHFGTPGAGGALVQYTATVGRLRLVVLDSTRPGEDGGQLDAERLAWLEAELGAAPEMPTLLAMHHPPLTTGVVAMDRIGLPAADRRALAGVLERHRQVRRVVGGHVHRAVVGELGGCGILAVPSTYLQARADFRSDELQFANEPPGFAIHALIGDELISHVQSCSVAPRRPG